MLIKTACARHFLLGSERQYGTKKRSWPNRVNSVWPRSWHNCRLPVRQSCHSVWAVNSDFGESTVIAQAVRRCRDSTDGCRLPVNVHSIVFRGLCCYDKLSEEACFGLFKQFWSTGSHDIQTAFIAGCISQHQISKHSVQAINGFKFWPTCMRKFSFWQPSVESLHRHTA